VYRVDKAERIAETIKSKELESQALAFIERLKNTPVEPYPDCDRPVAAYDPRWLSVAKTHFEQGFMALNRAIKDE